MSSFNPIIPIWKPVGYSTHIITKKVAELFGVKTSHTGTLDPMAEGVIIILTGEERLKKFEYARWHKTYVFEMLFGIKTDTFDGLGVADFGASAIGNKRELEMALKSILPEFVGLYIQEAPPYSAKKIKGKPLYWYARNDKLGEIIFPVIKGEIYDIKLLEASSLPLELIVKNISEKIDSTSGDLRQQDAKDSWTKLLTESVSRTFFLAKIEVNMSKGMYVRRLAVDIAKKLNSDAIVYSLTRTHNGAYNKSNSHTLEQIFGTNFQEKYNFDSSQN